MQRARPKPNKHKRFKRRMTAAARFEVHMMKAGAMIAGIANTAADASEARIREMVKDAVADETLVLRDQVDRLRTELDALKLQLAQPPGRLWKGRLEGRLERPVRR